MYSCALQKFTTCWQPLPKPSASHPRQRHTSHHGIPSQPHCFVMDASCCDALLDGNVHHQVNDIFTLNCCDFFVIVFFLHEFFWYELILVKVAFEIGKTSFNPLSATEGK